MGISTDAIIAFGFPIDDEGNFQEIKPLDELNIRLRELNKQLEDSGELDAHYSCSLTWMAEVKECLMHLADQPCDCKTASKLMDDDDTPPGLRTKLNQTCFPGLAKRLLSEIKE